MKECDVIIGKYGLWDWLLNRFRNFGDEVSKFYCLYIVWVWKSWGIDSCVNIFIVIFLGNMFYIFDVEMDLFCLGEEVMFFLMDIVLLILFCDIVEIFL